MALLRCRDLHQRALSADALGLPISAARRRHHRPADGSRRQPTGPARDWGPARCAPSSAWAYGPCAGHGPLWDAQGGRYRRRAVPLALFAESCHEDIEASSGPSSQPASRRWRWAAIIRSLTRSCAPSARSVRSAWSISTPIATPRDPMRARSFIMAPVPAGGPRRRARPGARHPDRHQGRGGVSLGFLL